MKIEYTDGCVNNSLTIDGKETVEMKINEIKDAVKKLVDKTEDLGTVQSVLISLVEAIGDYEDLGYCEQCGDITTRYSVTV